jgi:hypothetical protein
MRLNAYGILAKNLFTFIFVGIIFWAILLMVLREFFQGDVLYLVFSIIYFSTVYFVSFGQIKADLDKLTKLVIQDKEQALEEVEAAKINAKNIVDQAETEAKAIKIEIDLRKRLAEKDEEKWKAALKETSKGFPTLFKAIHDFEKHTDNLIIRRLKRPKRTPAPKATEKLKLEIAKRREAEYNYKVVQSIIEYYENIAPFLLDFKNEIIDEDETNKDYSREYDEDEKSDQVTKYIAKPEYQKLPETERNQLALDRYWDRWKSKREIGRLYECYVGYLYESKGYEVDYFGNIKGVEDLGRDLICKKGNEVIIIQCKKWSKFKQIFEKHIFQFFGTVFQYKQQHLGKTVRGAFYTSTKLSDLARDFAKEFGIELHEDHDLERYPCVKGNIGRDKEKIYHLPFDQQYDTIKIELDRGEEFFMTVKEAEDKDYRRAWRWRGKKD